MFAPLLRLKTLITPQSPHRFIHRSLPISDPKTHYQQLVINQTNISSTLASHIFTKISPNTNAIFCPLSVHIHLTQIALTAKDKTLKQLLGFLKTDNKHAFDSLFTRFSDIMVPHNGLDFHVSFHKNLLMSHPDVNKVTRVLFTHVYKTKGTWVEMFGCFEVKTSVFYLENGTKVTVPFMVKNNKEWLYEQFDGFKVLGFPHVVGQERYKHNYKFTVYILLPDAVNGLGSLIEKMASTPGFFDTHIPDKKVEIGELSVPMFKCFTEFDASGVLNELGLSLPFSARDGMVDMVDSTFHQNVFVSCIQHKYVFSMVGREDTRGKESFESVGVDLVAGDWVRDVWRRLKRNVDFVADRPFVFVIRDDVTKVVSFMGQVIDPSVRVDEDIVI